MANKEPEVLGPEEDGLAVPVSGDALRAITGGETDVQIATAKKWPRSMTGFRKEATELVMLDEETAGSCIYALPRGGKVLEGPSARFAEVVLYSFKNVRVQAQVLDQDDKFVTVRGMAWDIQNNVAKAVEVKRRITNKDGKRFNEDMISVTTAAASVIAIRNATLQLIPKAIWHPVYLAARKVIAGDAETLSSRRAKTLDYFMKLGVTNEKVFRALGVNGIEEVTLDHMVLLRGFATSIKDGEKSIDELFGDGQQPVSTAEPLDDYLAQLPADDQSRIAALITEAKLNKGQTAAKLKQFANDPKGLEADLAKIVALQRREDEKKKPVGQQADVPMGSAPMKDMPPKPVAEKLRGAEPSSSKLKLVPAETVETPSAEDIF